MKVTAEAFPCPSPPELSSHVPEKPRGVACFGESRSFLFSHDQQRPPPVSTVLADEDEERGEVNARKAFHD